MTFPKPYKFLKYKDSDKQYKEDKKLKQMMYVKFGIDLLMAITFVLFFNKQALLRNKHKKKPTNLNEKLKKAEIQQSQTLLLIEDFILS